MCAAEIIYFSFAIHPSRDGLVVPARRGTGRSGRPGEFFINAQTANGASGWTGGHDHLWCDFYGNPNFIALLPHVDRYLTHSNLSIKTPTIVVIVEKGTRFQPGEDREDQYCVCVFFYCDCLDSSNHRKKDS